MIPSPVPRPARLPACAIPFSRRSLTAASMSPPVSSSARLQSIMPAWVASRSCFTSAAVGVYVTSLILRLACGRLLRGRRRGSRRSAGARPRARSQPRRLRPPPEPRRSLSPSAASPFSDTKSDTLTPRFRPTATPSASTRMMSADERMASSFPGMTKSASSGSQFVSTSPITGMFRRRASRTASASFFMSITTIASGSLRVSATPPRLASSFSSSASVDCRSFGGRSSSWPSVFCRRSSCSTPMRSWIVR